MNTQKCRHCDKEIAYPETSPCRECKNKELKIEAVFFVGAIVVLFAIFFGIKILWANFVYNDWRCAFGECRLIK